MFSKHFGCVFLILAMTLIFAAIPNYLNYQGKVTTAAGVAPADGSYIMTFRICNTPAVGGVQWSETQPSVLVFKGLLDVRLGSVTPIDLPFDEQYYLEIEFAGETMSPRIPLSSVGYAYRSAIADSAVNAGSGGVTEINEGIGMLLIPDPITTTGLVSFDQTWGDGRYSRTSHTHNLTLNGDVTGTGIVGGTITTDIAANAVGTTELADGAVTLVKINTAGASDDDVMKIVSGTLQWAPDASGSGGDDWGIQTAVTNAPITGNGTAGSPIDISYSDGITVSGGALEVDPGTGVTVDASGVNVTYGTAGGTACEGNDTRLHDAGSDNQNLFDRIQNNGGANTYTVTTQTDILRFNNGTNTTVNVSQTGNRVDVSYDATGAGGTEWTDAGIYLYPADLGDAGPHYYRVYETGAAAGGLYVENNGGGVEIAIRGLKSVTTWGNPYGGLGAGVTGSGARCGVSAYATGGATATSAALDAQNVPGASVDAIGVRGRCIPASGFGYGGWFEGGKNAVYGQVNAPNDEAARFVNTAGSGIGGGLYAEGRCEAIYAKASAPVGVQSYGIEGELGNTATRGAAVRGCLEALGAEGQLARIDAGTGDYIGVYGSGNDYAGYFTGGVFKMPDFATSAGLTTHEGAMFWDNDDDELYVYDGSAWGTVGSGGSPGGADTHVQYNNGGVFGGQAEFAWDDANYRLSIATPNYTDCSVNIDGGQYALRIEGDGSFQAGGRLTFGDWGNAYIEEPTDDELMIYAGGQGIQLYTGGNDGNSGDVLYSDGTYAYWGEPTGGTDNLGNHTATMNLNMQEWDIYNFDYLNGGGTVGNGGYGFRDFGGIVEYKNNGGSWTPMPSAPPAGSSTEWWYRPVAALYITPMSNPNIRVYDSGQIYGLYYDGSTNQYGGWFRTSSATSPTSAIVGFSDVTGNQTYGYLGYNGTWTAPTAGFGDIDGAAVYGVVDDPGRVAGFFRTTGSATYAATIAYSDVWTPGFFYGDHIDAAFNGRPAIYGSMNTHVDVAADQPAVWGRSEYLGGTTANLGYTIGGKFAAVGNEQDAIGVSVYAGGDETNIAGEFSTGTAWGRVGREGTTTYGGFFDGMVGTGDYAYIGYNSGGTDYAILSSGTKSTIMETREGRRILFCPESPEVWFEDFGSAKLENGHCHVELEALFLDCVKINQDHPMKVFIQLNGNCNGVYVEKGATGFDVLELGDGRSDVVFDYRIVAKRKGDGYEDVRFPIAPGREQRSVTSQDYENKKEKTTNIDEQTNFHAK